MELDDLKGIWLKEKKEMEGRIAINEALINKMNLDSSKGSFDKLLTTAILGRNLALVYMTISLFFVVKEFYNYEYSLPALIGAIAMLFSFIQHWSLKRFDFCTMSTVELHKAICEFRIHTLRHAHYDTAVVCLWLLTLLPISAKFHLFNFSNVLLCGVIILMIVLALLYSKGIYKNWDIQLRENEFQLTRIMEFENE